MASPVITSTSIQSITIKSGEQFTLPPNATVLFTTNDNGLQTTCDILPGVQLKCYSMKWSVNEQQSDSPNLEDNEYKAVFFIGNKEYVIVDTGGPGGSGAWIESPESITDVIPAGVLFEAAVDYSDTGARHSTTFTFKTAENLASQLKLKITGPGYDYGLYVFPVEVDCTTGIAV